MSPVQVQQFCEHLRVRNYSPHTIDNYALDLRLFFDSVSKPVKKITGRDVDGFVQQQHSQGLTATTINRRLHAIKRFFDFLVVQESIDLGVAQ